MDRIEYSPGQRWEFLNSREWISVDKQPTDNDICGFLNIVKGLCLYTIMLLKAHQLASHIRVYIVLNKLFDALLLNLLIIKNYQITKECVSHERLRTNKQHV